MKPRLIDPPTTRPLSRRRALKLLGVGTLGVTTLGTGTVSAGRSHSYSKCPPNAGKLAEKYERKAARLIASAERLEARAAELREKAGDDPNGPPTPPPTGGGQD